jgi:hypothetical protein
MEWSTYNSQITKMRWKCRPLYMQILFQLIVALKTQLQHSFLHLQHTRHQLSLDDFSNCVAVLALDFDTPVSWAIRFRDFLGVCSSLVPKSSNFSLVNTRSLCFCFLSITNPVVLSLFTKLRIVCLLRTLSSRNFRLHFPTDPYFTWVTYRNTRCFKVYPHLYAPHCSITVTENKWLMDLITTAYWWQIINKLYAWTTLLAVWCNTVKSTC